jgi:hypothetical protein
MRDLVIGLLILAAWAVLQFAVQPETGWIHVGLIVGVIMVIRGIVLSGESTPTS